MALNWVYSYLLMFAFKKQLEATFEKTLCKDKVFLIFLNFEEKLKIRN